MKEMHTDQCNELTKLCDKVRAYVYDGEYESCMEIILDAMQKYPHAPEPHNLIGIILEKTGDHTNAMKHFRAAIALDPGYQAATQNLYNYGTFYSKGKIAFDESDVIEERERQAEVYYNDYGFGRVYYKKR